MKLKKCLLLLILCFVMFSFVIPVGVHANSTVNNAAEFVEGPSYSDIKQYNNFLHNLLVDKSFYFVTLSMLHDMGAFGHFIANSFIDPNAYTYVFTDINDYRYSLHIVHEKDSLNFEDNLFVEVYPSPENMLYLDTNESKCSIIINDVIYTYFDGQLVDFCFFVGDVAFVVSPVNQVSRFIDYPLGQERTFLSQMLSGNDTEAAFAITKLRIQILWGWIQPFVIAVVLIIAACVLVAFLIKKRRKAKHIPAVNNTSD